MVYSKLKKNLISVLKLDKEAMLKVASDSGATKWGVLILLVPPVVNLILASFAFPSGFGVMFSRVMFWPMLIPAISIVGVIFLMSELAVRFFGGVGASIGFFRVVSYSAVVLWVSVVPFVLGLFGILDPTGLYNLIWLIGVIWIFVVSYQMLQFHHKLTSKDAGTVIAMGSYYRFWY